MGDEIQEQSLAVIRRSVMGVWPQLTV